MALVMVARPTYAFASVIKRARGIDGLFDESVNHSGLHVNLPSFADSMKLIETIAML